MMYLIKDKHGLSQEVLEVQPETLTTFQVEDAFAYFMKTRRINSITDFDIRGFQKYLYGKYGVTSRSVRPHPLNMKV